MSLFSIEDSNPLGEGRLSAEGSVTDRGLAELLLNYKRTIASRYVAAIEMELDELTPRGELNVSKKIDGQLWYAVFDEQKAFLANPKGKVISGEHPLVLELGKLAKATAGRVVVAGELYAEGERERPRCGDIAGALGGGAKAEVERMRFAAFDICQREAQVDEAPPGKEGEDAFAYGPRLAELQRIFEGGERCTCVHTEQVSGVSAVRALYSDWVASGSEEGIVVRAANHRILKVKPEIHIDAAIIGYTIRREDAEQCSSVLLGLMREDGSMHELGSCGNLGEESFRKELLSMLTGTEVESAYRRASTTGALYRFVEPKTVVEIKATDVQAESASGDPVRRMVLHFDKESGWKRLQKMPIASILHPVFVKLRPDKSVTEADIRIAQLDAHVFVTESKSVVESITLKPSEILRREVYTKTAKDKTMVRKLVMWKTNKESAESGYAPFVVHFTDYSSGRKDPLAREVRLAGTLEKASAIADSMIDKNIKKGWTLVE